MLSQASTLQAREAGRGDRKEGRSREIGLETESQVRFCLAVLSKQEQHLSREVKTRM